MVVFLAGSVFTNTVINQSVPLPTADGNNNINREETKKDRMGREKTGRNEKMN